MVNGILAVRVIYGSAFRNIIKIELLQQKIVAHLS